MSDSLLEEPKRSQWQVGKGFRLEDRILFCRQLATFVRSGVPLLHGMQIIIGQTKRPVLREAYSHIVLALQRGQSLSQALARRPRVFPRLMTDLVEASEQTGRLDIVLSELAVHYERDLAIRRRIRQAMTYPTLVFGLAIIVVAILVAFVLPAFTRLFEEFEAELPTSARILLSTSRFMTNNWYILVGGALLVVLGMLLAYRRPGGKRFIHQAALKIPVVGKIMHLTITGRWARTLGSMVRAGVPIITGLHVASEVTGNTIYQGKLDEVSEKVARGEGMSAPLAQSGLFPDMVVQMVHVGEETGGLDEHLEHVAGYYESELNYRIDQALGYLEPIVLVVVGLGVGFVAISLVSTMYRLAEVL